MSLFVVSCAHKSASSVVNQPSVTQTEPATRTSTTQAPSATVLSTATNTVLPSPTETATLAWRGLPKGLYLFFRYDDIEGLYALSISDHQVTKILDQYVTNAMRTTDNQHAILLDGSDTKILDLQDGSEITPQLPTEFPVPYFIAFSPVDKDTIWVAGYPGHGLPINGDGSFLYYYRSDNNFEFRVQGSWPVWSPDGRYVAYEKETYVSPPASMTVAYADIALLVIPCQASNAKPCREIKLTNSSLKAEARKPSWAPDSKTLAYECSSMNSDGMIVAQDICIIGANGSGLRRLNTTDIFESYPLWSPAGDSLAFAGASPQYWPSDLYLLDVKSEAISNLTNTPEHSEIPLFWWNNP